MRAVLEQGDGESDLATNGIGIGGGRSKRRNGRKGGRTARACY